MAKTSIARAAAFALVLAAGSAAASPKAEIEAAFAKFVAAKSYHVAMFHDDAGVPATEADFVAPDRFRLETPAGTQLIIGDTMYMSMQGTTMKVPLPAGTLTQWRDPGSVRRHAATMTVTALGDDVVDGRPARKYEVRNTHPQPSTSLMWIGADGYPLQVRASGESGGRTATTTIRYSRFDDPSIRIALPK